MNTHDFHVARRRLLACTLLATLLALAPWSPAQSPLADGAPVVVEALSGEELQTLVGPVALYPDDLLAIVLPASTYPLQIVQAARYLGEFDGDDTLKPDPSWDESVVALLNYPDVLRRMSDDLEWTQSLGDAVVVQQAEVIEAIEGFRDRAYDAGNLKSDRHQRVEREDDAIIITPVEREVIYVPYYEPERVVVVQRAPVYHYYPQPYPVYYYPYPAHHAFHRGHFWGVTSAYSIGWHANFLHINLHNYASHPYYRRSYVHHHYYHHRYQPPRYRHRPVADSRGRYAHYRDRSYAGDPWRPRARRAAQRIERKRATPVRVQANAFRSRHQNSPVARSHATRSAENRGVRTALRSSERRESRASSPQRDSNTQRGSATQRGLESRRNLDSRRGLETRRNVETRRGGNTQRRRAEPRVGLLRSTREAHTTPRDTRVGAQRRVTTQRQTATPKPRRQVDRAATPTPDRPAARSQRAGRRDVRETPRRAPAQRPAPRNDRRAAPPKARPRKEPRPAASADATGPSQSRESRALQRETKAPRRSRANTSRQRER